MFKQPLCRKLDEDDHRSAPRVSCHSPVRRTTIGASRLDPWACASMIDIVPQGSSIGTTAWSALRPTLLIGRVQSDSGSAECSDGIGLLGYVRSSPVAEVVGRVRTHPEGSGRVSFPVAVHVR